MVANPRMTTAECARVYAARGWSYIPVPFKSKKPIVDQWQNLRLTVVDIPQHFNGQSQNIGTLLGIPSNGLIDVDVDATEAVRLAPHFLPRSQCRFHRRYAAGQGQH